MSRIVVLDDEEVVRAVIVEMLRHSGYDPIGFESPREAVELAVGDPAVTLVISDLTMPGFSGFELLRELQERRPGLPVVLVTGAGTEENLAEAAALGAAAVIVKPFSHAELRAVVASLYEPAEEVA